MDDRPNGRPADQAEERRAEAIEARNRQAVINKADRLAKSENVQRPPESENVQRPPEAENVQRPPGTEDASNELSPNGSQEDGGDWQRAVRDERLAAFLEQNLQEREMGRPERAPAGDRSTPLPLDKQPQIQTDEPSLVADAVLVSSLKVILTQCGIELPGGVAGIAPEMRRILSDLSEGPDPFDVDVGESSDPIEHPADRRERRTVKIGRAGHAMFKAVCDGMASSGSTKLPDWSQVGPAFELWAHRAFERLRNRP